MVSSSIYVVSLTLSIIAFSLNLSALLNPTWITFETPIHSPIHLRTSYGLFQRCSETLLPFDGQPSVTCRKFPTRSLDCGSGEGRFVEEGLGEWEVEVEQARKRLGKEKKGGDEEEDDEPSWSFCDSWITAGYLAQLSLLFSITSAFSSLLVLLSFSRAKRANGWRLAAFLSTVHAALLSGAFGLVLREFRTRERFWVGCRLDSAFIMATVSWSLSAVAVAGLFGAGLGAYGSEEDGYRTIGDGE